MNNQANKAGQHRGVGRVAGRQRVTMHDIARVAGCSQTTVSLVLNKNDSVKISEDTKQRVPDAANTLGYAMPSQLRKPQTARAGQRRWTEPSLLSWMIWRRAPKW